MKSGSIGVCLSDTRNPPRMFQLTDQPLHMGIAYFEPLDDPGALVSFPLADFWPLIDSL